MTVGPFTLSPQQVILFIHTIALLLRIVSGSSLNRPFPLQIAIGIQTNIIVFPVSLLIIQLFRKSKLRKKRKSHLGPAMRMFNHPTNSPSYYEVGLVSTPSVTGSLIHTNINAVLFSHSSVLVIICVRFELKSCSYQAFNV